MEFAINMTKNNLKLTEVSNTIKPATETIEIMAFAFGLEMLFFGSELNLRGC